MSEFKPNKGQVEALQKLGEFLADPDAFEFCLSGFAGTGKTTVIQRAYEEFRAKNKSLIGGGLAMSAPTHKAVKVLSAMAVEQNLPVQVATIHKMLALQKSYVEDKVVFVQNPKVEPMVKFLTAVVIDECSMVGEGLDALIRPYIEGKRVKVIWMGDRLQLPPVDDTKARGEASAESRSFSAPASHDLTEVMRNGGVIGEAIAKIRDNITAKVPELARAAKDERGTIEVYGARLWFRRFLEELESDLDVVALAYTNKSVDWINQHVRLAKFGPNVEPYVAGETLEAVSSFEQMGKIVFYTGERMKVVKAERAEEHFAGFSLPCWELEVILEDGSTDLIATFDASQTAEYAKQVVAARDRAKKDRSLWGAYYELKERFCSVRQGYATTIHKSQGSTYDKVFLAQSDVLKSCQDPELRNRLLYVGYSRTKSGLYLS